MQDKENIMEELSEEDISCCMRLWDGIRQDALMEWEGLNRRGVKKTFLLSERLRLMSIRERKQICHITGWTNEQLGEALNKMHHIVCRHEYPEGRPHYPAHRINELK